MVRRAALFSFALLLLSGCATNDEEVNHEPIGVVSQAITNGTLDDSDSAVVALLHQGDVYCTGVLVGPYAVATAGHCVNDIKPDQVFFGDDPKSGDGTIIQVADMQLHPEFDPDTLANDIAIVGLKSAAPAKPVTLVDANAIDDSWVGKDLKLVGFGLTKHTDTDTGPKRVGATKIDSLDDATFHFKGEPSQTCEGDSGGPAFVKVDGKNQLIGLTSSGDSDCQVYGRDTRVDIHLDFIQGYSTEFAVRITSPIQNAGCSSTRGNAGGNGAWALVALGLLLRRRAKGTSRRAQTA